MAFIQDINVSIASGTARAERIGFRPLVMGSDTAEITEIVASELSDLVTAGYATTDPEYLMASAMFAQNPSPADILVYRKADDRGGYQEISSTPLTFVGETVPAITANTYDLDVTIDGGGLNQLAIAIAVTDDWFTIAAALQAALRTATGSTETIVITNGRIRCTSATTGGSSSVLIAAGTAGSGGGDLLTKIDTLTDMTTTIESAVAGGAQLYSEALAILITRLTNANQFRTVCIDSRTLSDLNDVGTWASANEKLFFGGIDNVLAGSGRNLEGEAYLISSSQAEFPECAWVGKNIGKVPGSNTWKWQVLAGVTAANYSLTDLNTIRSLKTQAPTNQAGLIYVNEGFVTSGEYIDVILGRMWIAEELEARLLELYLNEEKVPMDDPGIMQTENVIRRVLKEAGVNGIIAVAASKADQANSDDGEYQFKIVSPLSSEISASDKAARKLAISFSYILAGAQHEVTVTGKVTAGT